MSNSKISIIIPLLKISKYITDESLPAFEKQSYQHFEVILLPNLIEDNNKLLTKKYPFVRIIETKGVSRPAAKRDIGAKQAKGNILAFIDDDAFPEKDWLENAVKLFEKDFAVICGPGMVPKNGQFWERVFQSVLESPLGSGGYTYRFKPEKCRIVDDYPSMNFLVKKVTFFQAGGFNSDFWPGEDSKLCENIVYKLDGKILYDPSVLVYHHRRPNLAHFLKQHGAYGYHRGAFFAHGDKNSRRISYLIPTMFVSYLLFIIYYLLQLISTKFYELQPIYFTPLIIYFILLCYQSFSSITNTKSLKIAFYSSIVLFLMHVYYGAQFVHGYIIGIVKKDKIYGR